jgi:general secretion pathway protein I
VDLRARAAEKGKHVSGRRAFSLIEVLIALAIFALCAIVLGSAYVNILLSYEAVKHNEATDADVAFARQLVLNEPDRTKVEQGGDFDTAAGNRVHWSAEIASSAVADLFAVTFTCEISDPAKPEPWKSTQTFMLLRPTWSTDVAEHDKLRQDARTRIVELQQKKS